MSSKSKIKLLLFGLGITITGIFGLPYFTHAETKIDNLDIHSGQTQTFTPAASPYIIKTGIFVEKGGKLIITRGTVLKFQKDSILFIDTGAELEINGHNSDFNRVYLTSYNNKNIYPEFSGPDDPQPADWIGIYFNNGSQGTITGAHLTYGDALAPPDPDPVPPLPGDDYDPEHQGVITVDYQAEVKIYDSTITNNYGGIMNYGNLTVYNSEIYDNEEYGVWNYGPKNVKATHNWWGFNSGPNHQTLNHQGQGNRINSTVDFDPWTLKNPPVIIIPGILGSWENHKGEWVPDPIFHTYENLTRGFISQGYKENETLFPLGYNWRKSNVETAKFLKDKINEAKQKGKSPRVDIVAHSMGGLVARQYIESGEYENDIAHLVTLGTPHQGSPDSYLTWEGGIKKEEVVGSVKQDIKQKLLKIYFLFEAREEGYNALYKYIREKVPSVNELLPVYDYLRDAQTKAMRPYPDNYPRNEFLENLNSEENLKKFKERPNLEFINLVGRGAENNTVDIIRVIDLPEKFKDPENLLWPHGYPEGLDKMFGDHGLEFGEGDGTVPLKSAASIGSPKTSPLTHHELATETFDQVYYELTKTNPGHPVPPKLNPFTRFLFSRVHSPIDFQIIDPQGRRIGKDFITNEAINEIPHAFYSGFNTDLEFITIPDPVDGTYQIIAKGTDAGGYELKITSIDEEQTQEQSYTNQTQIGENINFEVQYTQETLSPITNTNEFYTIEDLIKKLKDYDHDGSINDVHVKNYLKHLLRGVEIGVKRINQVEKELEEINEKLSRPDLKPQTRQALEYRKWLYEERKEFHQEIIIRNLNQFINKTNHYQPTIITPEAASTLITMARNILARYQ